MGDMRQRQLPFAVQDHRAQIAAYAPNYAPREPTRPPTALETGG